ncbi:MAG: transglutaminase family protein, partial [Bdellovibrionales bacterium]|nr:transglutaminase family protein [Bdellovibrionales bacterium]
EFPDIENGRGINVNSDKIFESSRRILRRTFYRGISHTISRNIDWVAPGKEYLQVTALAPKTEELAHKIQRESKTSRQVVQKILNLFSQGFLYSLSTTPMTSMDDFLFEKRKGFCEHFAGSMGTLLRLAGVPARVVLGYQGGTQSFLSDYLLVRQMDAHAWVEYWDLEDQTWIRVDPTSVVAPERLAMGAEAFASEYLATTEYQGNPGIGAWVLQGWKPGWTRAQLVLDQIESSWMSFLLRYDFDYQQALLKKLGFVAINRWQLLSFSIGILALIVLLLSWRLTRVRPSKDLGVRVFERLRQKLEKKGLSRCGNEGPLGLKNRAVLQFPEGREKIAELFDEYMVLRYGSEGLDSISSKKLRRKIAQL